MKMITAMVQDEDAGSLIATLTSQGIRATKISSTGGFLRRGNATLIVGVEEEQVEDVISIIKGCCCRRNLLVNTDPTGTSEATFPIISRVEVGGAVVFVTEVERFERI